MSLKRRLRELKEEKEKEYKERALSIQPISRNSGITNQLVFVIKGDACVCFGDFERTRYSKINMYKRVLFCNFNKTNRLLEIELINSKPQLSRFQHVVRMLKDQPDVQAHDFGFVLEKHQQHVIEQENLKAIMQSSPEYPLVAAKIMEESMYFEQRVKEMVRGMEERGEIRFYTYKLIKLNLENFMYEIKKYIISELFVALLGATPEQIQDFIVRKGLFDSSDTQEMYFHMKQFLSFRQEKVAKFSMHGAIRTFDGISIDANIHYTMMLSADLLGTTNTMFENSEFLMLYDFDITPAMLKRVKEIRATSSFSFDQWENEHDWEYAQEVDRFFDTFYKGDLLLKKKLKTLMHDSNNSDDGMILPTITNTSINTNTNESNSNRNILHDLQLTNHSNSNDDYDDDRQSNLEHEEDMQQSQSNIDTSNLLKSPSVNSQSSCPFD